MYGSGMQEKASLPHVDLFLFHFLCPPQLPTPSTSKNVELRFPESHLS